MIRRFNSCSVFLICTVLFVSCSGNKIHNEWKDIKNYQWKREHKVEFDVTVEDANAKYDVILGIRHSIYYVFANIKINIKTVYPSGETRSKDHDLFLRSEEGKFLGEGAGDIYDMEFLINEDVSFPEAGIYHYEVQNIMPYVETDDIMQVGLIVKKKS